MLFRSVYAGLGALWGQIKPANTGLPGFTAQALSGISLQCCSATSVRPECRLAMVNENALIRRYCLADAERTNSASASPSTVLVAIEHNSSPSGCRNDSRWDLDNLQSCRDTLRGTAKGVLVPSICAVLVLSRKLVL